MNSPVMSLPGSPSPQNVNTQPLQPVNASNNQVQREHRVEDVHAHDTGLPAEDSAPPALLGCCQCLSQNIFVNQQIMQGYVGVVQERGRFVRTAGAGLQNFNMNSQVIVQIPIMMQVKTMPLQSVLTKDGLKLLIRSFVRYQIISPELYLFNHSNPEDLMVKTVSGMFRAVIGMNTLQDNLLHRQEIKMAIVQSCCHRIEKYGIIIHDAEIEQMTMEHGEERAMAAMAEAQRNADALVVKSRATLESSKNIIKAANELMKNPLSMQLQYFELMKNLTGGRSTLLLRDSFVHEFRKKTIKERELAKAALQPFDDTQTNTIVPSKDIFNETEI